MMNQAVIPTDELYAWARAQGNLGIAVLFVRHYEQRTLTPQIVAQAIKVRDRQIADGRVVVKTERITRRPPVEQTTSAISVSTQDESILPERTVAPVTRTNPWSGTYTVETDDGHRTFKVRVQPSDAEYAAGKTVISLLTGPDNEGDYTDFGFLRDGRLTPFRSFRVGHEQLLEAATAFLRNPDDALVSKSCGRCGRTLTTPESIERGFGPECSKLGFR